MKNIHNFNKYNMLRQYHPTVRVDSIYKPLVGSLPTNGLGPLDARMDENERRPTIADMEALAQMKACLPAASFPELARRAGWTVEGLRKRKKLLSAHCGGEILVEDENGLLDFSRDARQLYDYVRPILKAHHAIRNWPPVHEIVIAASHRTAAFYLPTFVKRFLDEVDEARRLRKEFLNEQAEAKDVADSDVDEGRVQISIHEGATKDHLWRQLRNGDTDFVVRGFLLNSNSMPKDKIPEDIEVLPFSPPYRVFAVSRTKLPARVSLGDLFGRGRVGILQLNLDDLVESLQGFAHLLKKKPLTDLETKCAQDNELPEHTHLLHLPLPGLITCESYSALMSFVQQSICTGLVFLPPAFSLKAGLYAAEVIELSWATRAFIMASKKMLQSLQSMSPPTNADVWRREHYLAKFRDILWDATNQELAIKPAYRNFPFI